MSTELRLKRTELEKMSLTQIVDDDRVKKRFVSLYNARTNRSDGAKFYDLTVESFIRTITESEELRKCTALSLYSAFIDMAHFGINVAKNPQPLGYLLWDNVKVSGGQDNPVYERRARLEISPYGEIAIHQNMSQIKYADNPVIVYEDDEYEEYLKEGKKCIDYRKNFNSKSHKIKAAFLKIVRSDDSVDFATIDMRQVERLKGYSERKNRGAANKLYTSNDGQPDEGFLTAKLIKHAFKSYPRIPKATMSAATFVTDKVEEDVEDTDDIYGVEDEKVETVEVQEVKLTNSAKQIDMF